MPTKTETENWVIIDAVIATSKRVLLHGLPGTGKTYAAARQNLGDDNQKVYQITMTEETPAAEIRGHFLPKGDEMVWMDGPAVLAWKEGARLVINEIDRASACGDNCVNDDPVLGFGWHGGFALFLSFDFGRVGFRDWNWWNEAHIFEEYFSFDFYT